MPEERVLFEWMRKEITLGSYHGIELEVQVSSMATYNAAYMMLEESFTTVYSLTEGVDLLCKVVNAVVTSCVRWQLLAKVQTQWLPLKVI